MQAPYVIDGVLEPTLSLRIQQKLDTVGWKFGWHSNKELVNLPYFFYPIVPTRYNLKENRMDISRHLTDEFAEAWEQLKPRFEGSHLVRCYAHAQCYGLEGFPHTDSAVATDRTVVLYFCSNWKREYGGETVIYDANGEIVFTAVPRFNRALVLDGSTVHQARSVTRACPGLRITAVYKLAQS